MWIRNELEMIVIYIGITLAVVTVGLYAGITDLFMLGGVATVAAAIIVAGIMALQGGGGVTNFFGGGQPVYVVAVDGNFTLESTLQAIRDLGMTPVVIQSA